MNREGHMEKRVRAACGTLIRALTPVGWTVAQAAFGKKVLTRSATLFAFISAALSTSGAAEDKPADVVAAHVRSQGHACEKPVSAERDHEASKPDHAVWVLECKNAVYRVRLTPDMRANVKRID